LKIDDRPRDEETAFKGLQPLQIELPGGFLKQHGLQDVIFRDERGAGLEFEKRAILIERYGPEKIEMFLGHPLN